MASTPILPFSRWMSGTNQNSVPANDNSLRNQILNGLVISKAITAQPASPADGDIYILPATHTGTQWDGFDEDDLVIFMGGSWYAFSPVPGIVVNFDGSQEQYAVGSPGGWSPVSGGGGGGGVVVSVVAGTNVTVDSTDPANPIVSASGSASRTPAVQAVTSSATVTPTFSDDMVKITAQAAALAIANPTGTAIDGLGMVIRIKDNGTARAITWGTQYRGIGIPLPSTTVISKMLYVSMIFNTEDTKWDVLATGQE